MSNLNNMSSNLFDSFKNKNTLNAELNLRLIKILDIGYITVIYFILGLITSRILDKYFGKFNKDEDNKKNIINVGTEIVVIMWVLAILIYLARNLVESIPSPFDGVLGFQHNLVKELGSASVFAMILFSYFYFFKAKLDYFNKRINNTFNIHGPSSEKKY
jgi:hypothetical protein